MKNKSQLWCKKNTREIVTIMRNKVEFIRHKVANWFIKVKSLLTDNFSIYSLTFLRQKKS